MEFHALLIDHAKKHDFTLVGALDLDTVLGPDGAFLDHLKRFDGWLESGFDGAMGYLKRGRDRRADPRLVFPEAQSILCVAVPYERSPQGSADPAHGPRYARYLRGHDYHDVLAARLETMMRDLAQAQPDLAWKVCVDTSAVLERSWAVLAGLGWIGKNTTLIHPKHGSYLFLGEVLINRRVGKGPSFLPNYCGNCTRCLDGCPTSAFTSAGNLDSRRCISYWTLEKRGPLELSFSDRRAMGTWVAGCDICQEVCPFNLKPSRESVPHAKQGDSTELTTWRELLSETEAQYLERVKTSALNRVKPAQFSRNLAIALSNAIEDIPPDELEELRLLIEERAAQSEEWAIVNSSLEKALSRAPR